MAEQAERDRCIVVGVDGSDGSRRALTWAARHARRLDAMLRIVMAWHTPAGALTPMGTAIMLPPATEMRERAEERMAIFVESASHDAGLAMTRYETVVDEREAGHLLCEVSSDADLLVVGSRGLGGFKGLVLGSVSAHCANAAPCPVAIIPDAWDPDAPVHDAVVVGVDGSDLALAAVRWADAWAAPETRLDIVCGWTIPVSFDLGGLEVDMGVLEDACEQIVAKAAEEVTGRETRALCLRGDPRLVLPEATEEADVLVIGARGHSGLRRLFAGSIASSIIHHLVAPTIVVRDD